MLRGHQIRSVMITSEYLKPWQYIGLQNVQHFFLILDDTLQWRQFETTKSAREVCVSVGTSHFEKTLKTSDCSLALQLILKIFSTHSNADERSRSQSLDGPYGYSSRFCLRPRCARIRNR